MPIPEFFLSTRATSGWASRARQGGRARRIVGNLLTSDVTTPLDVLVPTHLREIIAVLCEGGVIEARSAALTARPAEDGSVFIAHTVTREVSLPGGITLRIRRGPGPVDIDIAQTSGRLWLSSDPRQLLEHLEPSRSRGGRARRTFRREELEAWLDRKASIEDGEEHLNWMRDEAGRIAPALGLEEHVPEARDLIGAFLGTRDVKAVSAHLRARQRGRPYDQTRTSRFDTLRDHLFARAPQVVATPPPGRRALLPFVDSYFSNYIEGTEFDFGEAAAIIFDGVEPVNRPADAHDIRGTHALLASAAEMSERPGSPEHLRALLVRRHRILLAGRPEKQPGAFKQRANRAGATIFVAPKLVAGTLDQGFARYAELTDPFARAVFMMFLVAEVHPFDDGNGRLARVMMNAELLATAQAPVLIPTVLRNDYLYALRAMTNHGSPDALVAVLDFGRRYASRLDCAGVDAVRRDLERTNAFAEPDQPGIRLTLPDA